MISPKLTGKGIFLMVLLCVAVNSHSQTGNRSKHALLFAIGNYPEVGGWDKLSSLNDLTHLSKALAVQGFASANVTKVVNEQATRDGITKAFAALVNRVKRGDIVVVHFSCHGTQLEADNTNKIDRLDECVVPIDAKSPEKIDINNEVVLQKEMGRYLRGHVLGDLLKQVRAKLGSDGDLAVFLDFCSSGGATRGANKVRGGKRPLVSKNFDASRHTKSDSSLLFRQAVTLVDESALSPYVVISATRPEELDTETEDEKGNSIGPLSYAVYKTFLNLDSKTTYRSFFAKIQSFMQQKVKEQHPLLEGNGINRELLGGAFVQQTAFWEVEQLLSPKQLRIKGGLLAGLGIGAKLSIYPAGTIDPSKSEAMATGVVTRADQFSAELLTDNQIKVTTPAEIWAFVKEQVFAMQPVSVKMITAKTASIETVFTENEVGAIKTALQKNTSVTFTDTPDVWIVKGDKIDSIKLASNGYLFDTLSHAVFYPDILAQKMLRLAQYRFLQAMNTREAGVSVEIKLVPVVDGKADTGLIQSKMVNGVYEFTDGDVVTLSIKNTGTKNIFVNILDLQPDGIIGAILPKTRVPQGQKVVEPHDLFFQAGTDAFIFKPEDYRIRLRGPYGTELFKVFASTNEINLENIASTKGETTRGNLSTLETLVKKSYQGVTKRGGEVETGAVGNADGTTLDLYFRIKPKQ